MDEISLVDFAAYVDAAVSEYPNAKVISVGTGMRNGEWYFCVWIKNSEGCEVCIDIPCRT